jgi:hypothetical protein
MIIVKNAGKFGMTKLLAAALTSSCNKAGSADRFATADGLTHGDMQQPTTKHPSAANNGILDAIAHRRLVPGFL